LETIIVHHRSIHHAKNSGYGRLVDFMPNAQILNKRQLIPYRIAKFIGSKSNQNAGIYNSDSVLKEIELFKLLIKNRKESTVVHYLNGERDIRYAINNSRFFLKTKFCATFHKPPELLEQQISNKAYLEKLNGAIAVGANQVEFLKNWLNIDKVKYIPHGVDTDFFTPDASKVKNHTLLFVGQHLRDFEAFNYCIPRIADKIKELRVNVVMRKDFFKFITPHPSISLHSDVNDNELKEFYQEANLLFLPLLNSTACNSILEAMACGLPIITTDIGGNLGYLKNTKNVLAPKGDFNYLIDAALEILSNESKSLQMRENSRNKALELDWKNSAKEIRGFYKHLEVI